MALHQQAGDQLESNDPSGAGEEGSVKYWKIPNSGWSVLALVERYQAIP